MDHRGEPLIGDDIIDTVYMKSTWRVGRTFKEPLIKSLWSLGFGFLRRSTSCIHEIWREAISRRQSQLMARNAGRLP